MGVGFGNEAQLSGSVIPEPVTFKGDANKKNHTSCQDGGPHGPMS